jgi:hypothetical protein
MANRKRIPPEPLRPAVPGGATRPSLRVNLARYETVARRRTLNARLLAATCAFTPAPSGALNVRDVELLQKVAAERFSPEQALVRIQAIRELGRARSLQGVNQLVGLAMSPVEGEHVRAASSASLMSASPEVARVVLAGLRSDVSRLVQQTASQLTGARPGASGAPSPERRRPKRRRALREPAPDSYRTGR